MIRVERGRSSVNWLQLVHCALGIIAGRKVRVSVPGTHFLSFRSVELSVSLPSRLLNSAFSGSEPLSLSSDDESSEDSSDYEDVGSSVGTSSSGTGLGSLAADLSAS